MPRLRTIIVILLVAGAAYYGYGKFFGSHGGWGGAPGGAPTVSVAEVIERDVQQWHEFSGRLVAVDQVEIRPRVSGTIDSVHFKDGVLVNKGDLLFIIDPRPFQAAIEAANARAVLADSELQRAKTLLADKAIAQRDFDQRKNAAAVAKADLTAAQLNLDYTKIKSPITGRVSRAEITAGNLVESGSGAPVLTTVVSSTPIYADFDIDENTYMQYVHAANGKQDMHDIPVIMSLAGEADAAHNGHVESFDNRLSPTSGTIRVRAAFDNADGMLVPGLFARVKLGTLGSDKALLITDRAVGTDQNKKFVLVVGADNKTEHREVQLAGLADDLRVVESGLKPGEKIIVSGMQRVMMPGQPVTPEIVPMDAKDAPPAAAPPADAGGEADKDAKPDAAAKENP